MQGGQPTRHPARGAHLSTTAHPSRTPKGGGRRRTLRMAGHLLSGGAKPPRKEGRKTPAKAAAALVATQASFCVGAVLLRASLAGDGKGEEYEPAVFG